MTSKVLFALLILVMSISSQACDCGHSGASERRDLHNDSRSPAGLKRIYKGWETPPHKYPWMAHLRFTVPGTAYFTQCGGFIIDDESILTAAHCVHQENGQLHPAENVEVYLGAHDKDADKGDRYGVVRIVADENYSVKRELDYDIAILKLDRKVDLNHSKKIQKACLPADDTTEFIKLTVAGWGSLDAEGTSTSHLQEVDVDFIPRDICMSYKLSYYEILSKAEKVRLVAPPMHSNHMCALNTDTRGSFCAGDSGGPLMYQNPDTKRYIVVGIVSGAWNKCGTRLTPGLYTKVANYRDFIREHASGACFKSYSE